VHFTHPKEADQPRTSLGAYCCDGRSTQAHRAVCVEGRTCTAVAACLARTTLAVGVASPPAPRHVNAAHCWSGMGQTRLTTHTHTVSCTQHAAATNTWAGRLHTKETTQGSDATHRAAATAAWGDGMQGVGWAARRRPMHSVGCCRPRTHAVCQCTQLLVGAPALTTVLQQPRTHTLCGSATTHTSAHTRNCCLFVEAQGAHAHARDCQQCRACSYSAVLAHTHATHRSCRNTSTHIDHTPSRTRNLYVQGQHRQIVQRRARATCVRV
jgi:hypothetical protein